MGMQFSMPQAEHLKLAEGFEAFASSAQTALSPGWVPGPLCPCSGATAGSGC